MNNDQFKKECADEIRIQAEDETFFQLSQQWINVAQRHKYSYHFEWLGRPVIQYPQDMLAMQELIWSVKPDLIIETGIAHGGSLVFSASMLELNAVCGGPPDAQVLGIDIDIRKHNRNAIEQHPLFHRITMLEGSSVEPDIVAQVARQASTRHRVMVFLDSNHTHEHVLAELEAYGPLVSRKSYCVVFDTLIENLPEESIGDRPWGPGNNPATAVKKYLRNHPEFQVDASIDKKLMVTVAPGGYLKKS